MCLFVKAFAYLIYRKNVVFTTNDDSASTRPEKGGDQEMIRKMTEKIRGEFVRASDDSNGVTIFEVQRGRMRHGGEPYLVFIDVNRGEHFFGKSSGEYQLFDPLLRLFGL